MVIFVKKTNPKLMLFHRDKKQANIPISKTTATRRNEPCKTEAAFVPNAVQGHGPTHTISMLPVFDWADCISVDRILTLVKISSAFHIPSMQVPKLFQVATHQLLFNNKRFHFESLRSVVTAVRDSLKVCVNGWSESDTVRCLKCRLLNIHNVSRVSSIPFFR